MDEQEETNTTYQSSKRRNDNRQIVRRGWTRRINRCAPQICLTYYGMYSHSYLARLPKMRAQQFIEDSLLRVPVIDSSHLTRANIASHCYTPNSSSIR